MDEIIPALRQVGNLQAVLSRAADLGRELHAAGPADQRDLPLAFLAPDIVEAILAGRQPAKLTVTAFSRGLDLPGSWAEQRRLLGFA